MNDVTEKPIPSPFWGGHDSSDVMMFDSIKAILENHGVDQWCMLISREHDAIRDKWIVVGNAMSEGLVKTLEHTAENMKDKLDKLNEDETT